MRLLYEDTMPYAGDYFSQLGEVTAYSWQNLTADDLINVDVLAVRSTTKVNAQLLQSANRLHTVATATAGTNHMDLAYLNKLGINCYAASGCNAIAVAQYVVSALMFAHECHDLDYRQIKVGIIGAGQVGTALSAMLDALHIPYVLCDPPIENIDKREFVSLQRALQCDVVSLHVPYITQGAFPTANLIDKNALEKLTSKQWLINACRGEVLDESHLIKIKQAGHGPKLVLDVWQNEPNINEALLECAELATPHIAGHTDEGKIRGTKMVFDYVCRTHGFKPNFNPAIAHFLPTLSPINLMQNRSAFSLSAFLLSIYDISADHRNFVENMAKSNAFSLLRKQYQGRREYSAYRLSASNMLTRSHITVLRELGFIISVD